MTFHARYDFGHTEHFYFMEKDETLWSIFNRVRCYFAFIDYTIDNRLAIVQKVLLRSLISIFVVRAQSDSRAVVKHQIRAQDWRWFRPPHDVRECADCGSFGGVSHQTAAHRMDAVPYTNGQ